MPEQKKDYTSIALKYCKDIISGKIPACNYVKLSCQRHINDLSKQSDSDYPYRFDKALANRRCKFSEAFTHVKGKWAGQKLKLEPFQIFIQCCLFGWIKKESGKRRFRISYIELPRKNGKALEISTPIFTPDGWKRHGELIAGDYVFSPSGKPVKVLGATEHYKGECLRLYFSDGDSIIAHKRHEWVTERLWYTKRHKGSRNKTLPFVETQEIADTLKCGARQDFVHRIKISKPLITEYKNLPIDPYALGAWLGDGHSAAALITCADIEIIDRIKISGWPIRISHLSGAVTTYSISDGSRIQKDRNKSFASKLRGLGVLGNKHIPDEYLLSDIDQRYELLRGLLDTDGTISKAGQISITLASKKLIDGVLELLRTLGIKANLKQRIAKIGKKECGPAYLIHFFPQNNIKLFHIKRKADRQKDISGNKKRRSSKTICGMDDVGIKHVNCIEVEGGLYLAGNALTITHNSTMAATDGLYMLAADGEKSSEVYSGATTEKQALEVFRPAWQMAQKSDGFKEKFKASLSGTPRNPTSIYILSDMSRFEPIVGKPGDGSSPQCAIIDEFHEANTSDQYDSMDTGMGAREQPLMDVITTAGTNTSSPCYEMHMKAVKVLEGTIQDDSFFSIIYTIDQGKDYRDFNVWIEANPNYGVSIQKDFLFQKYTETMTDVNKQNINLCKHLNVWTNAGTAWMNMTKWKACEDKTLKISDYHGKNCYVALDLANKIDICAKVMLFSDGYVETERESTNEETGEVSTRRTLKEKFVFFSKFYLPEDTVNLPGNDHYANYQKENLLTVTSGARTDFKFIEDDIKSDNKIYPIQELAFDPREATYLINNIQEWASFECIEVNQGPTMMSEPMKELEALVYDGLIRHDGNKIFTWMMGNVIKKQGRNSGPVKYYYPTKQKDSDKIDGCVALIMCVGQAMLQKPPEKSFWES